MRPLWFTRRPIPSMIGVSSSLRVVVTVSRVSPRCTTVNVRHMSTTTTADGSSTAGATVIQKRRRCPSFAAVAVEEVSSPGPSVGSSSTSSALWTLRVSQDAAARLSALRARNLLSFVSLSASSSRGGLLQAGDPEKKGDTAPEDAKHKKEDEEATPTNKKDDKEEKKFPLKPPAQAGKKDAMDKKEGGDGGGSGKNSPEKDEDGEDGEDDEPDANRYARAAMQLVAGITAVAIGCYFASLPKGRQIAWTHLQMMADDVDSIQVYDHYAQVTSHRNGTASYIGLDPSNTMETQSHLDELGHLRRIDQAPFELQFVGQGYAEVVLGVIAVVAWVVPFVFTPLYVTFLSQATGSMLRTALRSAAKQQGTDDKTSNAAKLFKVTRQTHVKFPDIAGMVEPKHEVEEIVDFLKHPDKYVKMGAKIPSGAMLLGPPGTGKTLLAKAVAGESDVAFIPCVGSDFVEMYVGMGALRVRKLFELAKKQKKCIVYIDEIDAIGLKRGGGMGGERQEQEHTLNELLTQLDGFNSAENKIIVLASSNVEQAQLDPALIRPGRFDRLVHIEAPVLSERVEIFKYHLSKLRLVDTPVAETKANDTTTSDHDGDGDDEQPGGGGRRDPVAVPSAADTKPPAEGKQPDEPHAAPPRTPALASASVEMEDPSTGAAPSVSSTPADATRESSTAVVTTTGGGAESDMVKGAATDDTHDTTDIAPLSEREKLVDAYAVRMADLCPGFVGADISNVCNEAAILAARELCDIVKIDHLERSIDRVLAGIEQRSRVMSPFEKKVVAHHEAGHAVAGWFLKRADPLMKVSMVPRGGKALGYAQYLPNENMQRSGDDIIDSICVTLGGRVAEKIFFDHLSTGASDDLQKVTRMAYAHVSSFGRRTAYPPPGTSQTAYRKPFGEKTGSDIDVAAKALVDRAYQRTYDLLLAHKNDMERLAKRLYDNEVLTHADVVELLGDRPSKDKDRRRV